MTNIEKILVFVLLGFIAFGIWLKPIIVVVPLDKNQQDKASVPVSDVNLGTQIVQPYSYFGATNSSSSVPTTATTTNPVLSRDNTRINALVCNNSAFKVFLHQKNVATTTGVTVNTGIWLSPIGLTTSTANICAEFPGFKGYLYSIGSAAGWLTVSEWK